MAFLSLCGAATSQTTTPAATSSNQYLNNQVQLGDVIAGQTLDVSEAPSGVSGVTTAVANAVSATGSNADLAFQSKQAASGAVMATTNANVTYDSTAYYVTSTSATGNTATTGTCCGTLSGTSTQTLTSPGVTSTDNAYLGGYSAAVSADSTALGNTVGYNVSNGVLNATSHQTSTAPVSAYTNATIHAADSASYVATAVANDVEADTTNSPVTLAVKQSQTGATTANAAADVSYGGDSAVVGSAVGNNANVYADNYGNFVDVGQSNSGGVSANAQQTLGTWYGTAASSAYGVGNSTVIANAGSYTGVTSDQTNSGDINVSSTVYGNGSLGDGGNAISSATGVGNAVSAYACASCNGTISAKNRQVNSGSVKVSAGLSASSGLTGEASGVSSAIGNTATYQVVSSGTD